MIPRAVALQMLGCLALASAISTGSIFYPDLTITVVVSLTCGGVLLWLIASAIFGDRP